MPNSNLLVVRYRSSDPSKGAEVVNTLLDLYRDKYLELRRNPGVVEFFVDQRDQLEQSLKASEAALTSFQKKTGLLSAAVQVDAYARRLAEAENNLTDAQFDMLEAESAPRDSHEASRRRSRSACSCRRRSSTTP